MSARSCVQFMLLVCLIVPVVGCGSAEVDSISVSPTTQSLLIGQTVQFTATGSYGHGANHPAALHDVTSLAKWASSAPSIATVSSTGLVTAVAAGTATITASMNGFTGVVSGTATVVVINPTGTTGSVQGLLSLEIIPSSVTVLNLQGTGQFLAIGTFATAPTVRDLTNSVNWISSAPNIFPISTNGTGAAASGTTAGIITAYGSGNADVIAEAVDPKTGSIQTAQATFNCPYKPPTVDSTTGKVTDVGTCNEDTLASALFSTLTIYSAGLNTTGWLITAPSSTGTANVIHCGPGSQTAGLGAPVCTATYAINPVLPAFPTTLCPNVNVPCTPIIVTAPAEPGVKFGGWSANCLPSDQNGNPLTSPPYFSETGPNWCVVNLTVNDTVGAVFN
jgi:hypothetical protein